MKDESEITLERIEQFMRLLTSEWLPEHWMPDDRPKMTPRQAFGIVYYLQEHLSVFPDHYEQCCTCDGLYDSECGGFTIDTTNEPDDWHDTVGVTKKMIEESGGALVCSMECELDFWRAKFPDWRPT